MSIEAVLQQLKAERQRIDAAIAALEGSAGMSSDKPAKRQMSPESREKMREAAKKRWAKRRAEGAAEAEVEAQPEPRARSRKKR